METLGLRVFPFGFPRPHKAHQKELGLVRLPGSTTRGKCHNKVGTVVAIAPHRDRVSRTPVEVVKRAW